jgi:formylglycine-generating enzyme required for sulfatase activity
MNYNNNEKRFELNKDKIAAFEKDSILKTNDSRVYKGASWEDDNEWLNPFTRRSMNKYESSATIGFRCAMDRLGSPVGLGKQKKSKSNSKTEVE